MTLSCTCGHPKDQHGQERKFYDCDDSKREVCLECPGYEEPGYPNGAAWHRYQPAFTKSDLFGGKTT